MNEFVNLEEKTICICRELIPVGSTRKNIEKFSAMRNDEFIYNNKYVINDLIKKMAIEKIEAALQKVKSELDFSTMFALINELDGKQNEERNEIMKELFAERVSLLNKLSTVFDFKFKSKKTIDVMLPKYIENHDLKDKDELIKMVEIIKKRQDKFAKFEQNLDNILSMNLKKGTLSYRILVENPQIHYENIKRLSSFDYVSILRDDVPEEASIFANDISLAAYESLMSQKHIDAYNFCIGIINQKVSEYCQKEKVSSYSNLELSTLRKLPLTEKKSFFDKIPFFESDDELIETYNKVINNLNSHSLNINALTNDSSLFIKSNRINNYSNIVYGKWNTVSSCLEEYCNENKIKDKELIKKLSIYDIDNIVSEYSEKLGISVNKNSIQQLIKTSFSGSKYAESKKPAVPLRNDDCNEKYEIKKNLDKAIKFVNILKLFDTENENFSFVARQEIERALDVYADVHPLYNMSRNYISQKGDNKRKKGLSFSTSGFGSGWSESVESQKRVFLLKDDSDNKFLGVYNILGCKVNNKSVISVSGCIKESLGDKKTSQCYSKMICGTIGDVKKGIPRLFINPCLPEPELTRFKNKEYNEDREFLSFIIDFIKKQISNHETWKAYDFNYKDNYDSYEEFCEDLQQQGYILKWRYIDKTIIDNMVESGCIYLFKINCKYDKFTTSKKSIHEKYVEALFSDENENGKLVKLLGGAEVFYREPQIKNPSVHKAGSVLLNKNYKEGKTVGTEYTNLLKKAQREEITGIKAKKCREDIIKDKRYTKEQFSIHFNVKIGNAFESKTKVDTLALEKLKKSHNTLVVTRSNKHFLYAIVLDNKMNILEKRSLNTVLGINYKEKLEVAEELQRKNIASWKEIKSTKGLMNGYISYAVREVANLVLKYDAAVVLEKAMINENSYNLLKKRTYTNFRNALMRKLQFLNDITKKDTEPGGVLNPYNLTHIEKDKDLDKELNGIVLQIPAFFTSNKDINSEFVLLKSIFAKNETQKKNIISKFTKLNFNPERNLFELEYESSRFNNKYKNVFVCDSYGERTIRRNGQTEKVNLTDYIKNLLLENDLDYRNVDNLYDIYNPDNKTHVNALYESIRLILQMYNYDADKSFYISPVSHAIVKGNDCREEVQCINMYNSSKELLKKYCN